MPKKARGSKSATKVMGASTALARKFEDNLHKFQYAIIVAELDVAITFCNVAMLTIRRERADENVVRATNAYEAATALLEETNLTIPETAVVEERLRQVDEVMEQARMRLHPGERGANRRHPYPPALTFEGSAPSANSRGK